MNGKISLQRISALRIDLKALAKGLHNGNSFDCLTLAALASTGGKFALYNVLFLPMLISVLSQK